MHGIEFLKPEIIQFSTVRSSNFSHEKSVTSRSQASSLVVATLSTCKNSPWMTAALYSRRVRKPRFFNNRASSSLSTTA